MKCFILQQQNKNGISSKNNILLMIIFVAPLLLILLFTMPVYAQSSYLFPSDIIDQAEQSQYDVGRVNRYASQRKWIYPEDTQTEWPYAPEQANPLIQFSREFHYPGENYVKQPGGHNFQREIKKDFVPQAEYMYQRKYIQSNPGLLYPSDMEVNRRSINKNSYSPNSFSSNISRPGSFPANSFPTKKDYDRQAGQARQNTRIQYVPVPVYSVPGTLPGTVPGVVTPGKMVPGYSHLSPDYNYGGLSSGFPRSGFPRSGFPGSGLPRSGLFSGLQDQRLFNWRGLNNSGISPFLGPQYNPMTGLGIFPGGSNLSDTFYKSYDDHSQNTSPFASPDTMVPGFSMPDMYAPH